MSANVVLGTISANVSRWSRPLCYLLCTNIQLPYLLFVVFLCLNILTSVDAFPAVQRRFNQTRWKRDGKLCSIGARCLMKVLLLFFIMQRTQAVSTAKVSPSSWASPARALATASCSTFGATPPLIAANVCPSIQSMLTTNIASKVCLCVFVDIYFRICFVHRVRNVFALFFLLLSTPSAARIDEPCEYSESCQYLTSHSECSSETNLCKCKSGSDPKYGDNKEIIQCVQGKHFDCLFGRNSFFRFYNLLVWFD